jgi:hypothetical protein
MATQPRNYAQILLSGMPEEEVYDLWKRLRLFAYSQYGWLKDNYGWDIENEISASICAAFDGTRKWPAETENLTIYKFICGILYSKASHFLEKEKKVEKIPLDDSSVGEISRVENFPRSSNPDHQIYISQLCKKLKALFCSDPLVIRIIHYLEEMPDMKIKEIIEYTGLGENEIRNAMKRLDRKAKLLLEEGNHE